MRVGLDRLVEVGDGAVDVALVLVDGAAVVERDGEVRVELDRLVEVGDGAVRSPLRFHSMARLLKTPA